MRLSGLFAGLNLAFKALQTASREPQDIPEVLKMVNAHAIKKCGQPFSTTLGEVNPDFNVRGRGYDALPAPGFPTCWIWCPNGYRFKVALDAAQRDILGEDFSHMG